MVAELPGDGEPDLLADLALGGLDAALVHRLGVLLELGELEAGLEGLVLALGHGGGDVGLLALFLDGGELDVDGHVLVHEHGDVVAGGGGDHDALGLGLVAGEGISWFVGKGCVTLGRERLFLHEIHLFLWTISIGVLWFYEEEETLLRF